MKGRETGQFLGYHLNGISTQKINLIIQTIYKKIYVTIHDQIYLTLLAELQFILSIHKKVSFHSFS